MNGQEILSAIEQERLRSAYLRHEIQQATNAHDRNFATQLVDRVIGTRDHAVKQAAITWVIQNLLGKF